MTDSPTASPGPATAGILRIHAQILRQLAWMSELARGPAAELAARTPAVSSWSVAEQLEHLVLVDRSVRKTLSRLLDHQELRPTAGINLVGRLVLGSGYMPRGRVRTTAAYFPAAMSPEALQAAIGESDGALRALAPRLPELDAWAGRRCGMALRPERFRRRVQHPVMGGLDGRQWLRFMAVHHHHHLKIVRDIRRALGAAAVGLPSR